MPVTAPGVLRLPVVAYRVLRAIKPPEIATKLFELGQMEVLHGVPCRIPEGNKHTPRDQNRYRCRLKAEVPRGLLNREPRWKVL